MALELYRPEEATRTRGVLAALMAALLGFGVFSLYEFLALGFWQQDLARGALGDEFPLSPRVLLCLGLLVVMGIGIYLVCNHKRVVDFLIETEVEMGKVSWAPRHEVVSSSVVVVITVAILGLYFWVIDSLIALFQTKIPWDSVWQSLLGGS